MSRKHRFYNCLVLSSGSLPSSSLVWKEKILYVQFYDIIVVISIMNYPLPIPPLATRYHYLERRSYLAIAYLRQRFEKRSYLISGKHYRHNTIERSSSTRKKKSRETNPAILYLRKKPRETNSPRNLSFKLLPKGKTPKSPKDKTP
jgi:hypothetical protein